MSASARATLAFTLALALSVGCGSDHSHEADAPDPAELACEEADEEGSTIEASPDRDDSAPELELGGEPYTVTVSETEPTYVRVEITEDSAALLLASLEDAVVGLCHGDEEEELMGAGPVEACADDIPEHFDVDFHEPGTYFVELAPSATGRLWLLLSPADGHGHEHSDE